MGGLRGAHPLWRQGDRHERLQRARAVQERRADRGVRGRACRLVRARRGALPATPKRRTAWASCSWGATEAWTQGALERERARSRRARSPPWASQLPHSLGSRCAVSPNSRSRPRAWRINRADTVPVPDASPTLASGVENARARDAALLAEPSSTLARQAISGPVRYRALRGQIVDARSGQGLPYVSVRCRSDDQLLSEAVLTDLNGRFVSPSTGSDAALPVGHRRRELEAARSGRTRACRQRCSRRVVRACRGRTDDDRAALRRGRGQGTLEGAAAGVPWIRSGAGSHRACSRPMGRSSRATSRSSTSQPGPQDLRAGRQRKRVLARRDRGRWCGGRARGRHRGRSVHGHALRQGRRRGPPTGRAHLVALHGRIAPASRACTRSRRTTLVGGSCTTSSRE